MRRSDVIAMAFGAGLGLVVTTANADAASNVLDQLFAPASQGCMDTVKVNLENSIRAGIDKEVQRHEAALQKPPSLGDLGCLDSLMNVNLDFAIKVPSLTGLFNSALSDAKNKICSYAQQEWNKVTQPLQSALQLPSFSNLQLPNGASGGSGPTLNFNYESSTGQLDTTPPTMPNYPATDNNTANPYAPGGS